MHDNGLATLSVLGFGFALGLRHALDADHLVAVSAIVSERKSLRSSALVGLLWGCGHTAALLLVGLAMITLDLQIPERLASTVELGVALMMIALGSNVLYKLMRGGRIHLHVHMHQDFVHSHPHVHTHTGEQLHAHHGMPLSLFLGRLIDHAARGKKSLLVGMVHGLAGSAALMLIVLTTLSSPALALAYIGVFGLGSVGGMMLMSTLIGFPFVLAAQKSGQAHNFLQWCSGLVGIAFGLFYVWRMTMNGHLLF